MLRKYSCPLERIHTSFSSYSFENWIDIFSLSFEICVLIFSLIIGNSSKVNTFIFIQILFSKSIIFCHHFQITQALQSTGTYKFKSPLHLTLDKNGHGNIASSLLLIASCAYLLTAEVLFPHFGISSIGTTTICSQKLYISYLTFFSTKLWT